MLPPSGDLAGFDRSAAELGAPSGSGKGSTAIRRHGLPGSLRGLHLLQQRVQAGLLAPADMGVHEGPELGQQDRLRRRRLRAGQSDHGFGVAWQVPDQDPQPPHGHHPMSMRVTPPVVAQVEPVDALEVGLDGVRVVADQLSEADDSPTVSIPIVLA
jgi:hypothetical protein